MYVEGSCANSYTSMLKVKASDMHIYVRYCTARQSKMTHGHRTVRDRYVLAVAVASHFPSLPRAVFRYLLTGYLSPSKKDQTCYYMVRAGSRLFHLRRPAL